MHQGICKADLFFWGGAITKHTAFLLVMLLLAACGGTGDSQTASDAPGVIIRQPVDGSAIYAPALYIAGSSGQAQTFRVQISGDGGEVLAQATVEAAAGEWSLELVHNYTGEPIEAVIRAVPVTDAADDESETIYSAVSVLLADLSYRPDGTRGRITVPADGDDMGGDVIPVAGLASGVADNAITLTLTAEDGRVLDTQTIAMRNPYLIDELGWEGTVSAGDYTGPATLTALFPASEGGDDASARVRINITGAAG